MDWRRGYDGAVSKAPVFVLGLLGGCASPQSRPPELQPEIITDCPAALAAEKEQAAREGRKYRPIVQKGALVSDLHAPRNRVRVTFDMVQAAHGGPLRVVARLFVDPRGGVEKVEIVQGSGVPAFDRAAAEVMRTWKHRPFVVDCVPFPYIYPTTYEHRS